MALAWRNVFSMLMGMESPDTRRKADDSYRARSAGRSMCATGLVALRERVTDGKTSKFPIDRSLADRIALDHRLCCLSERSARRTRDRDPGRRIDRGMFRIARGHSEGRALSIQLIIAVALGGSIGSVARYLVGI